ncbi:hypothetical protein PCANB_000330 [Pneumocystis canis]|nr:hypothetical protein PCK1_000389 [Pneumocystis canis]KAG5437984.1 hypothetical protein PCANB_000330 [Pneumocystis canis]
MTLSQYQWHLRPRFDTGEFKIPWNIISKLVLFSMATTARLVMKLGQHVRVIGEDAFLKARASRRGLITVSNHLSVLDDPLLWGTLPLKTWTSGRIRWALAAADICFTQPLISLFFSLAQTLPIVRRGSGPFQLGIDEAIRLVSDPACAWIHVFPEGYVQQHPQYVMRYFRWGVSRLILEAALHSTQLPYIIPIFFHGMERIMPELPDQPHWLPRFGQTVEVRFGSPIPDTELQPYVDAWRKFQKDLLINTSSNIFNSPQFKNKLLGNNGSKTAQQLHSNLAALLQRHVNRLRKEAGFNDSDENILSTKGISSTTNSTLSENTSF